MSTINQRYKVYYKCKKTNNRPKLKKSPQRRGVTLRLRIVTPRKPNSARRPVTKLRLSSKRWALSHIPGSYGSYGHNLRRFSKVLVNGKGARDLPAVNYTNIRGKFDFNPVWGRKHRRSIYGVKQDPSLRTHVKRELRKFLYEFNKNNKNKINKYYKLS